MTFGLWDCFPSLGRLSVDSRRVFPQSKCCFVKAALPWILELLTTHFKYARGSVNDGYVQSLRALILNIYSQKCVPQINEEVEVRRPRGSSGGGPVDHTFNNKKHGEQICGV